MNTSNFCSFRWTDSLISISNCTVQFCCKTPPSLVSSELLNSEGVEIFSNFPKTVLERQRMLDGHRPDSCSYCWSLEEQGLPSTRRKSTSQPSFFGNIPPNLWAKSGKTKILEIVMSNHCQMSCLYCSPRFRSQWQKKVSDKKQQIPNSVGDHLKIPSQQPEEKVAHFRKLFFDYLEKNTSNLEEIIFIGGESLLQRDFFPLLKMLKTFRDPQRPKLSVRIVSNLSVTTLLFNSFLTQLESLGEFADFVLSPSIDSVGTKGEYIREGLDWTVFQNNLQNAVFSGLFKQIEFINTASCLSLLGLHDFLIFMTDIVKQSPQQQFSLIVNQVQNPFFLRPQLKLPGHSRALKQGLLFWENLEKDQATIFLEFIKFLESIVAIHQKPQESNFQSDYNDLIFFLDWMDSMSGKNYKNVFFELGDENNFGLSEGL